MNISAIWKRFSQDSPLGEYISLDEDFKPNKLHHLILSSSSESQFVQQITPMLTASSPVIVVLFAILFASLVINLIVLHTVISLPNRKRKSPATILVAHLSCVAILFALLCVALVSEYVQWVDLSGPGMCKFMYFLKSTVIGIFSLNIVAIIFERFRVFNCFNHGKLLLCRVIALVWITAIVANIPTIFMIAYKENIIPIGENRNGRSPEIKNGICKPTPLMDSFEATVTYEFVKFLLFHVLVVCYSLYAMYKIRSNLESLKLLKPVPNESMRKKLQTIRFIYVHLVIFILIWLPVGVLVFAYRVRTTKPSSPRKNLIIAAISGLLVFLYLVLNPLIYLCLDVGCCFCLRRKDRSAFPCVRRDTQEMGEENEVNANNSDTVTKVKVNKCTSEHGNGNGMEIVCIQSESDRESRKKPGCKLNKETNGVEGKCRIKSKVKTEAEQSADMSRISTFMESSDSSIK